MPSGPVSAKTAYYAMYKPARQWAADVQAASLVSGDIEGVPSEGGKYPMWTVTFVSPTKREVRTFVYATAEQPGKATKGIRIVGTAPWAGARPDALPFDNSEFVVDSDEAYKTATAKAATWLTKHPDLKAEVSLGYASRFPAPVWVFLWGNKKSGYLAYVNAKDGKILSK
jgi:hypothetical protein